MAVSYVLDEVFERHVAPREHPERPERLREIRARLTATDLERDGLRLPVRPADLDELGRVHKPGYLTGLERAIPDRRGWLDGDTYFCEDTWDAVLKAAGAAIDLTAAVLDGRASRGAALVRPPGHHATDSRAQGFCIVNNVAAAAASARASGASRVAIVDFDVHHGNGTEQIFYGDPDVLFMSVHQFPFYPGTGAPTDTGSGSGTGATINVGLPAGCGDADYRAVFDQVFAPAIERFCPDIILASAGFDAATADPLAQMKVSETGYRWIASRLVGLADAHAGGRLVAVLEGGYDLDGLAGGVVGMIEAMLGRPGLDLPDGDAALSELAIERTLMAHPGLEER
jgi:acetoin utilization deacetylase AcuC-like enzyme